MIGGTRGCERTAPSPVWRGYGISPTTVVTATRGTLLGWYGRRVRRRTPRRGKRTGDHAPFLGWRGVRPSVQTPQPLGEVVCFFDYW